MGESSRKVWQAWHFGQLQGSGVERRKTCFCGRDQYESVADVAFFTDARLWLSGVKHVFGYEVKSSVCCRK